ncbi:rhodanese-like domain-containing protein [Sphaerotilus uruguayifluvii]|uniref:Rhodanese-related sulfurtransferase n=1 Tax=Sphaerotilus uruguayifluvii TaxID=2735897 RepID=A0ABX2G0E6_9BURK|nr:rhodanese-like domain-containing protein [Leptothrix sp. C29]NRT55510.1 rhodanese-related sulfurtransferase [Leptothrix sp. C29]
MQPLAVTRLAEQVQTLAAAGHTPQLLDVREPWEIATASLSLPGARLLSIPMQQIPGRLAEIDPDQPVLALCHHGMRSLQVALFLERQGYPHTYNITGGIDAWSRQVDPAVPLY